MHNCLQSFDYADFKRRFHAAACERGIDPQMGATSYQAALIQAEQRKAAFYASGVYGWSEGRDIFSEKEDAVAWFKKAGVDAHPFEDALEEWGAEVLREVLREMKHDTPLKAIHAHQAAWENAMLAKVAAPVTAAS